MTAQRLALVRLGLASLVAAGADCGGNGARAVDLGVIDAAAPADDLDMTAANGGDGFDLGDGGTRPPDPPLPACVRTVPVASSTALNAATAAAQPGDCIVLDDGDYTFAAISRRGTADAPIVIRAKNLGKAGVPSGDLVLTASAWVVVQGLDWTSSGNLQLTDCDHCRLTRCRIHPAKEILNVDWVVVAGKSVYTRIDHNDLGPKTVLSNMVMLAGSGAQVVKYTRIDHNYFHDITRTTGNGWEAIRAGLSNLALSSGYSLIESNLFARCDGDPETISIKQSDAIVRYNTLRTTAGEITLREGNRNRVYGNYILGAGAADTGGIRVCGMDHLVWDNYIQDISEAGIFLEGGESNDMSVPGPEHYQVQRAQVVFNTIIGGRGIQNGNAGRAYEPIDCTIANNLVQGPSGQLFTIAGALNTRYEGNFANPTGGTAIGMTATAAQIRVADAQLVAAGELFKLSAHSPAIGAAVGSYPYVTDDVEGDPRLAPDVGADEWSSLSPVRPPLTLADVGPLSP